MLERLRALRHAPHVDDLLYAIVTTLIATCVALVVGILMGVATLPRTGTGTEVAPPSLPPSASALPDGAGPVLTLATVDAASQ